MAFLEHLHLEFPTERRLQGAAWELLQLKKKRGEQQIGTVLVAMQVSAMGLRVEPCQLRRGHCLIGSSMIVQTKDVDSTSQEAVCSQAIWALRRFPFLLGGEHLKDLDRLMSRASVLQSVASAVPPFSSDTFPCFVLAWLLRGILLQASDRQALD